MAVGFFCGRFFVYRGLRFAAGSAGTRLACGRSSDHRGDAADVSDQPLFAYALGAGHGIKTSCGQYLLWGSMLLVATIEEIGRGDRQRCIIFRLSESNPNEKEAVPRPAAVKVL